MYSATVRGPVYAPPPRHSDSCVMDTGLAAAAWNSTAAVVVVERGFVSEWEPWRTPSPCTQATRPSSRAGGSAAARTPPPGQISHAPGPEAPVHKTRAPSYRVNQSGGRKHTDARNVPAGLHEAFRTCRGAFTGAAASSGSALAGPRTTCRPSRQARSGSTLGAAAAAAAAAEAATAAPAAAAAAVPAGGKATGSRCCGQAAVEKVAVAAAAAGEKAAVQRGGSRPLAAAAGRWARESRRALRKWRPWRMETEGAPHGSSGPCRKAPLR